ncbi:TIGR04283 family arsenosugar biosynthesis glycosyltransferase [Coralliovum pocilloporae]|uniref:TIGR04283 family arsenosugar biosynthesis glycosyltransferase n=1 Tax=Coralliovum pocilloporae TaxID=3066369 RepID=UPI003306B98B
MLSVVIPTLNAGKILPQTLSALVPGAVAGLVSQVIIADGGSGDNTHAVSDDAGCDWLNAPEGRGSQLAAAAELARGDWLLFLHADTVLSEGWIREVEHFIERAERNDQTDRAAYFRFALDDLGGKARLLEKIVALRCALFALPYGDQGLLIHKQTYRALGGFRSVPLMEDVDLVRRVGRSRLYGLRTEAITSAVRYRKNGFLPRMMRNIVCLSLYYLGVPPRHIKRLYG